MIIMRVSLFAPVAQSVHMQIYLYLYMCDLPSGNQFTFSVFGFVLVSGVFWHWLFEWYVFEIVHKLTQPTMWMLRRALNNRCIYGWMCVLVEKVLW